MRSGDKIFARVQLVPGVTVSLFYDMVRLQRAENPGAFLSMGELLPAGLRTIGFSFGGVALVAAAMGWILRQRRMNAIQTIGTALVCSGGVGNLIDRLSRNGYVTDFLNVGVGPLRTGIFNIADFGLLLGVAVVVFSGAIDGRPARSE